MSGFGPLLRKELRQLFGTPIPYLVVAVFWVATGYFFSFNVFLVRATHMVTTFHNMSLMMMLVIPLITMRVFAEENKGGTLELLLTLPLAEVAIVAAKFTAVWLLMLVMLAGTSVAVVPLWFFGSPDVGPILGGYVGVFLLGTAFVSVGVLTSALAENQVSAATGCWALLLGLWFVDYLAGLQWGTAWVHTIQHLSFSLHARDLIRGIVGAPAAVYFLSLSGLCVAWAVQSLRFRRS